MVPKCPQCVQLWDRYYAAALEEFAWQERLATAARDDDAAAMAKLRIVVDFKLANTEAVRRDMASHRAWYARTQIHPVNKDGLNAGGGSKSPSSGVFFKACKQLIP